MTIRAPFSTQDLKTPEGIERVLRDLQKSIDAVDQATAASIPKLPSLSQLAAQIRNELQATGSAPLNLQGLLPTAGQAGTNIIEDTHAHRASLFTPPSAANLLYWETDRTVLYISVISSGSIVWVYAAGTMIGTSVSFPADLGTRDAGFHFITSDTLTEYEWTGSAWNTIGGLYQNLTNSATAANTDIFIIQHLLSNLAGAIGMAAGLLTQLVDSTKATVDGSRLETEITTATAATFTTAWSVWLRNAGAALAKVFRVLGTGALEIIGKIVLYNNSAPTDGQLLIGNTGGGTFDAATLTGTAHQIIVTNGSGSITLTTPQAIDTTSNVTFNNVTSNGTLTASTIAAPTSSAMTISTVTAGNITITSAGTSDIILSAGGHVEFGTFAAAAGETFNGTITIKDIGGTLRKVAIFA